MKLSELLSPWVEIAIEDCDITGLQNDSRQLKAGHVFLAYPGALTDGRLFIPQAIAANASVIVYEPENWPPNSMLPTEFRGIAFPGLSRHLAAIASRFFGDPADGMPITGVTGTNGKTTIAFQLAQAHALLGERAAYIGTLGQGEYTHLQLLANTTPDALVLQSLFHNYKSCGIKRVCMEVSSHALEQGRVDGLPFTQAIFTNLTHDHLDYHRTMENYAEAKALLFAGTSLETAIVNFDDPYVKYMTEPVKKGCRLLTYGIKEGAVVRALDWNVDMTGTDMTVVSPWGKCSFRINALGFFNVYNALAVFSSLLATGYPLQSVTEIMSQLNPAPGRMEVVNQKPCIIVDYAHTPDALENVLKTLVNVKQGKILVVLGCGGDRDKTKRPKMGEIAGRYADIAIITSDNPRSEDPYQIMEDIVQGLSGNNPVYKIADRKEAISRAIELGNDEDIILIAGKGHETYQQIGRTYHHFSDQEVVHALIG
ncbi:UDP-N-acetylmuramoyl-L-alanyl-D-glutamate--2,6-diaminopimelate ligase [Legionella spiritensis]|uniref:UDP-N-acetylmuramoyl-L-alanyl-D-glutamate--2,6-diaminopimelate ligase n=1 Tax=Legionella spiritensis TaxID=452 RepID=A0A0W0Z9T9_LEGSP|nr:UDP-N-acetylmuramoyl-L-alanyl-D-glutamate--2,6-diaminopimelate ligase [Legionella spiritensis]KTD65802.1 UDP-N-acetylmuramoylalanyl-D-glutamate-2, 6-diaminopimelate ligase [Legionella spiritensis]SNV41246.1 UDP-N-acetylmuramoylalanyl-D-glutamate-2, 6-diaminopimelate ligase [Legionella spiritensis]